MNYLIEIKYDGKGYHGWQLQSNADTVQQRVEQACERLFCEKISVNGCSRTDTGVHANGFVASFHAQKVLNTKNVISGLNNFLPDDIAVFSAKYVPDDFHARFSCKSKEYLYKIYNSQIRNPFFSGRALIYHTPIDIELLNKNAADFIGTHDFTSFRAEGSDVKTTVRTVKKAYFTSDGDGVFTFHVEADGFLYNMVRIMVGTLLYIQEGKIENGSIPSVIESKDRRKAGKTVPPDGLYLNKVYY